jgi:hypothetical protein
VHELIKQVAKCHEMRPSKRWAHVTATSVTLGMEFDPDKLDFVAHALGKLGFEPGREDRFTTYGPECECTRFFKLKKVPTARTWHIKLASDVHKLFEEHHTTLGELHLITRTGATVTHAEWRVLRYPNLGIRRDLKGVEDPDARMVSIGGKQRPVVMKQETMPVSAFASTNAFNVIDHGEMD